MVSYSLRLGLEYGLNREEMKALEFGSLLHDIGKIGVPDLILRKPSKLTEEEWVLMREHPQHDCHNIARLELRREVRNDFVCSSECKRSLALFRNGFY